MSNPSGDYTFSGLGFTALRFYQDGSAYIGGLISGEGSPTAISNGTYTDATGVVTFDANESPAGISDLSFTGTIILDLSGNVTAIAGTWTGRSFVHAPPTAGETAPAARKIGPVLPIFHAHGAWAAFNRQDIIQ